MPEQILYVNKKLTYLPDRMAVLILLQMVVMFVADVNSEAQSRLYGQHRLTVSTYPVHGNSREEMIRSMLERGPLAYDGKRHFAYTLWSIRIGQSRFEKLSAVRNPRDLKCYVSVQLPALSVGSRREGELLRSWQEFAGRMAEHESLHVKSALRTCRVLANSRIKAAQLKSFAARLNKRNQKLDQLTDYGKKSGVVLH